MKNNVIALDMGSYNTAIYRLGSGISLFEPSAVALEIGGRRKVKAVGEEAKRLIGKTAGKSSISFPVSEGAIADEKIASLMLENFLNKVTLKKLGMRPQVLLAAPCGLDNEELKKYVKVLNGVGVYSVDMVESPILTAIGLGAPISDSSSCFIIDIGGATTNVAAVSLDGVIAGVNVNMGGRNLDAMIAKHVDEIFGLKIGALTAENVKIQIGSLTENDCARMVVSGRDSSSGKPRSISISSQDITLPVKSFYDKLFEVVELVMSKFPAEVSAEIRSDGAYFAGGGSMIVGLGEYFKSKMAICANMSEEPELATAIGGGIVASNAALLKKLKIKR